MQSDVITKAVHALVSRPERFVMAPRKEGIFPCKAQAALKKAAMPHRIRSPIALLDMADGKLKILQGYREPLLIIRT